MNVSLKNIDATKGIVKLEIVKADYADKVEKSLRSFRQKAEMPGFRKGMVPMGMVKKMYGKHVLVEEINKLVSENLYNYIREKQTEHFGTNRCLTKLNRKKSLRYSGRLRILF